MKRLRVDRTMKKGMTAGAVLGVLTAVAVGVGSAVGAEVSAGPGSEETVVSGTGQDPIFQEINHFPPQNSTQPSSSADQAAAGLSAGWRTDENGAAHYYGEDGQMLLNTVTPDGEYVDGSGTWIPSQYDISRFTTIPADAKSLLVIEGYGSDARASFYVKAETGQSGSQQSEATKAADRSFGPGAVQNEAAETGTQWKKLTDTGGHVGEYGIGKEKEGDRKTPRGIYTLDIAFGTKPDPGNFKVPYLQVDDGHYWVGDSNSPYYNTMVNIHDTDAVFDRGASEHLSTIGGPGYYYCVSVGYNKEQTPYKGSAIFLHCMYGPYTAGCIAIPEEAMITLLENMEQPAYILMDDGENLKNY